MNVKKTLLAILVMAILGVVPAGAEDGAWLGTFRPAATVNFTGGLTDLHNSIGVTLGTHVSLARFGRLRFPTVGADVGFASICDPNGPEKVPGVHDPCAGHGAAGLVQLTGGFELVFDRLRQSKGFNSGSRVAQETSLVVAMTHVVAGPFHGQRGLNIGIARRWDW